MIAWLIAFGYLAVIGGACWFYSRHERACDRAYRLGKEDGINWVRRLDAERQSTDDCSWEEQFEHGGWAHDGFGCPRC